MTTKSNDRLVCPHCGSTEIRRSHRRGIERLLSVLGRLPFRCKECDTRFLARCPTSRVA